MNTNAEILKSRTVVEPVIKQTEEPDDDGEYPLYDSYVKKNIVTKPFKDTSILEVDVMGKSPEQAQQIGYELAMSWTKGKHQFVVATHIDHAHIHTHIQKTLFESFKFKNTQVFVSTHSTQLSSVSKISSMNILSRKDAKFSTS